MDFFDDSKILEKYGSISYKTPKFLNVNYVLKVISDLSKLNNKEDILKIFVKILNSSFNNKYFKIVENENEIKGKILEFRTRTNNYGMLEINGKLDVELFSNLKLCVNIISSLIESKSSLNIETTNKIKISPHIEILNSMDNISFILDKHFNFTFFNNYSEKFLELRNYEVFGKKIWELFPELKNTLFEDNLYKLLHGDKIKETTHFIMVNGEKVNFSVKYILYNNEIIVIFKQNNNIEIENAKVEDNSIKNLVIFAGGIAHDFNNYLSIILGHTSLLISDFEHHTEYSKNLVAIETATQKAAKLADQLLSFSGKKESSIEIVDLSHIVFELVSLFHVSIPENIQILYDLCDENLHIKINSTRLNQVIFNLILNGIESINESGIITIKTGHKHFTHDYLNSTLIDNNFSSGNYVYIDIEDNGSGMNTDTIEKIFNPFYTNKPSGRGLGLATVVSIVKENNGTIKVVSEPGKGSVFRIIFPEIDNTDNISEKDTYRMSSKWYASGNVLFVDDDEAIRKMGSALLKTIGFDEIFIATDGIDAIEQYKNHYMNIDIVILDMSLPLIKGEEIFKYLKNINKHVKVILSTTYCNPQYVRKLKETGVFEIINKPYNINELRYILRMASLS
jgi:signal transduction histidine kinase/CheY-like chemotaxis protein